MSQTARTVEIEYSGPLVGDRFRLGPKLGAGSQGQTFLARDELYGGRVVVAKRFELSEATGWKKYDLFEREARVLKLLDHPAIPKYLGHFESEPGVYHLVMDRAPGEPLRVGPRYDEPELRELLDRCLDVLDYLHRQGPPVIHRDIKPANIVRDSDGAISLVDFGGVRAALRPEGGSTVVGTFGFMAPEQLHGDAAPGTDVYGLGATLIALGARAQPEDIPRKGLQMQLAEPLEAYSDPLVKVLTHMTVPDPSERPQDVQDVRALLSRHALSRRKRRKLEKERKKRLSESDRLRREDDKRLARLGAETGEVLPLDLGIPQPFRAIVGLTVWGTATVGYLGLLALRALCLPVGFTVASAFVGQDKREKLREARDRAVASLRAGELGFRRLQRAGLAPRKQLPPAKSSSGD